MRASLSNDMKGVSNLAPRSSSTSNRSEHLPFNGAIEMFKFTNALKKIRLRDSLWRVNRKAFVRCPLRVLASFNDEKDQDQSKAKRPMSAKRVPFKYTECFLDANATDSKDPWNGSLL